MEFELLLLPIYGLMCDHMLVLLVTLFLFPPVFGGFLDLSAFLLPLFGLLGLEGRGRAPCGLELHVEQ